ncbi:MAG TPA: hypothetical protein VGL86_26435 [Polyangia bacterium]|jgi:hypothetical protein
MRRACVAVALFGLAGCGAPFNEVKPSEARDGVRVVYCGSAATSAQSIINSMEPPVGQTGGDNGMPEVKELNVCLRLENHGGDTARLDRTSVMLKCPRETDEPQADRDDQEVITHPGEAKEFHIIFHYTQLPSGEDVSLKFERALKIGDKPVKLPPIALRKR